MNAESLKTELTALRKDVDKLRHQMAVVLSFIAGATYKATTPKEMTFGEAKNSEGPEMTFGPKNDGN